MQDRIDPLIAERAPWAFERKPGRLIAQRALKAILGYNKTLRIARRADVMQSHDEIMDYVASLIVKRLKVSGLHHLPKHGPALLVANHPTGIADGIVLHHVVSQVRRDAFYYANKDILRVLPQLAPMILPVEWRIDQRSHAKTRQTLLDTEAAVKAGRLGVIFPAGRISKRIGLTLHERPWMASAAMISRKFDIPVIPLNIRARNSLMFYLGDALHPTLRDITLFHETQNKWRFGFEMTFGEPIDPASLPQRSGEAIEELRRVTLALGASHGTPPPPRRPSHRPAPASG
ncbi:1-acyl-sn-glycerol-3-phosphate acyltransferase [Poseidonocella sedimentorum]|uniref:Putative hemolysin n=1 Tax=Poseidonocella sedimentorum TaxID=871652 RepID=A0A1I6EQF3_9RHOB|nr:1-acyl-sn-glycerol-3-phosphate acyltransferase [Poseidonocella sedimentorum]SFR19905.1 Putative hemolysin [Poseidonocella sedimentorum]